MPAEHVRAAGLSDCEYERLTLAYWLGRLPGVEVEDVTIIVRARRRRDPVRTVVLEASTPPAACDPPSPSPGA